MHDESQPLFRSAEDAARWALSDGIEAITRNSLWEYIDSGPERPSRGLGGFDGAGQAGIIRSYIRELREPLDEILIAQACSVKVPCVCGRDCCSEWRTNPRWGHAVEQVACWWERVHAGDGFDRPRLLRGCLRRFFGEKVGIDALAKCSGLHRVTVSEFNGRVLKPLKPLKEAAWRELEDKLGAAGLIEGEGISAMPA